MVTLQQKIGIRIMHALTNITQPTYNAVVCRNLIVHRLWLTPPPSIPRSSLIPTYAGEASLCYTVIHTYRPLRHPGRGRIASVSVPPPCTRP